MTDSAEYLFSWTSNVVGGEAGEGQRQAETTEVIIQEVVRGGMKRHNSQPEAGAWEWARCWWARASWRVTSELATAGVSLSYADIWGKAFYSCCLNNEEEFASYPNRMDQENLATRANSLCSLEGGKEQNSSKWLKEVWFEMWCGSSPRWTWTQARVKTQIAITLLRSWTFS